MLINGSDLLKALGMLAEWRGLIGLPAKVAALEARIAQLEGRVGGKPGRDCPRCGHPEFRAVKARLADPPFDELGAQVWEMRCGHCGFEAAIDAPKG